MHSAGRVGGGIFSSFRSFRGGGGRQAGGKEWERKEPMFVISVVVGSTTASKSVPPFRRRW